MALRDLSSSTMATITSAWLDPARERPFVEACPRLAPLLGDIAAVHEGLLRFQRRSVTNAALMAEVVSRSARHDGTHDRLVRGLYWATTAIAELLGEGEDATALLVARDELLPEGIATVKLSYSDEVGNALLATERLSARSRAALKKHGVLGKKLSVWVGEWQQSARDLGASEADRVARLGGSDTEITSAADAVRARNEWIRVVSLVQALVPLEKGLDEATRLRIVQHLDAADAKARARSSKGAAEGEEPPAEGDPAPVDASPAAPAGKPSSPAPTPKAAPVDHAPVAPAAPAPVPA